MNQPKLKILLEVDTQLWRIEGNVGRGSDRLAVDLHHALVAHGAEGAPPQLLCGVDLAVWRDTLVVG